MKPHSRSLGLTFHFFACLLLEVKQDHVIGPFQRLSSQEGGRELPLGAAGPLRGAAAGPRVSGPLDHQVLGQGQGTYRSPEQASRWPGCAPGHSSPASVGWGPNGSVRWMGLERLRDKVRLPVPPSRGSRPPAAPRGLSSPWEGKEWGGGRVTGGLGPGEVNPRTDEAWLWVPASEPGPRDTGLHVNLSPSHVMAQVAPGRAPIC